MLDSNKATTTATNVGSVATNKLSDFLMRNWMRRSVVSWLALPLAGLFWVLLCLRGLAYRLGWYEQTRLPVPVIVVGNIFVGGTGKTPFVLWLIEALKKAGCKPGVISRGYGGQLAAPRIVTFDAAAIDVGDEPLLLAQQGQCPVVIGRHRVAAGQFLLNAFPEVDVIISDDGLQHLALMRDLEIVLFDSRGVGNGWLLPAGPLREPVNRRRDFTVVNLGADDVMNASFPASVYRMQLMGTCAERLMDRKQRQQLSQFDPSLGIIAAAGIGHPERFFTMLRKQGIQISVLPLPDHFGYAENPFAHLTANIILITEKDAVKCRQVHAIATDPRIWVVAADVHMEAGLLEQILEKLNGSTIT